MPAVFRPPSGTLPANSMNVFAACFLGLFSLKLSSLGNDIFIFSTRRSSRDVCITNSSSSVGFIGVVERGLSIGIVLNGQSRSISGRDEGGRNRGSNFGYLTSWSRCFTGRIGTATLFSRGRVVGM